MKPIYVIGETIDDTYFNLLYETWEKGVRYKVTEGSHKGDIRLESIHASGLITNPHKRPLAPIFPPGVTAITTEEYIDKYFLENIIDPNLNPNEEYRYSTWINGYQLNYPKFCKQIKCEHFKVEKNDFDDHYLEKCGEDKLTFGIEGRINEIKHCDAFKCPLNKQLTPIEWVINHFKEKGHGNNHCYINVGDSWTNFNYDILYNNELERKTSPCLKGLDFKIKNNQLITHVIYRSWDLFSAWPTNMGGFTLLNEYAAQEIGVEPGPLSFSSAGLHCYGHQIKSVKARINK